MRYYCNPCGDAVLAAMVAGELGMIDTPRQRNITAGNTVHAAGATWCADNGAFSDKFDETEWWDFLRRLQPQVSTCAFAVAPDVVGDARATLERSAPWLPKIRALGYPVALAAQNGIEDLKVPWEAFDVLFIGGCVECPEHGPTTDPIRTGRGAHQRSFCPVCRIQIHDWKHGPGAISIAHQAKAHHKLVHAGRINSGPLFQFASAPYPYGLGADSADGTFLTFGPDANLPRLRGWLNGVDQLDLFGEPA